MQDLFMMGNLSKGILHLYEAENDRKLWEMYLHSFPSESFEDWKKKTIESNAKAKELTHSEVTKEVDKSNSILETFRLERG